jgi:hypothetical protein
MNFWTWSQIRDKVERDLSLEDELFVDPTEMLGFGNEAVLEAEAVIHTLYEDYFLARSTITFVIGQEAYSLPSNIYGHKIRTFRYRNGSLLYEIEKLRDWKKFENYDWSNYNPAGTPKYQYFLLNSTAQQAAQIIIAPTPQEAGAYGTLYYLRHANPFSLDTDVLDIPEATNFVLQHVKMRCYESEVGHPNLAKAIEDTKEAKANFEATMSTMIPDANNEIEADTSIYDDHS